MKKVAVVEDPKGYHEFQKLNLNDDQAAMAALYTAIESKLKPRGSNFTPPKKKRKKKNK